MEGLLDDRAVPPVNKLVAKPKPATQVRPPTDDRKLTIPDWPFGKVKRGWRAGPMVAIGIDVWLSGGWGSREGRTNVW